VSICSWQGLLVLGVAISYLMLGLYYCLLFPGDTLVPSYQTCFPELITVTPTNFSESTLNIIQESSNIITVIAGTVSAVAVLFLLVIILMVSLVFSISLWRRAQRKKYVFF
jgi:hypothetical protein